MALRNFQRLHECKDQVTWICCIHICDSVNHLLWDCYSTGIRLEISTLIIKWYQEWTSRWIWWGKDSRACCLIRLVIWRCCWRCTNTVWCILNGSNITIHEHDIFAPRLGNLDIHKDYGQIFYLSYFAIIHRLVSFYLKYTYYWMVPNRNLEKCSLRSKSWSRWVEDEDHVQF